MEANIEAAKVFTDFTGLAELRNQARNKSPEALKEAAHLFESVLIQMALKSMRDANKAFESGLLGSNDIDHYRSMFDQQLSVTLSSGRGLGLAKSLVRQLSKGYNAKEVDPAESKKTVNTNVSDLIEKSKSKAESIKPLTQAQSIEVVKTNTAEPSAFATPEEFIKTLWPHAKKFAQLLGIEPKLMLAQAALETGWGKMMIKHNNGNNSHNLFGIKADPSWKQDKATILTTEVRNGIVQKERAGFRAYDSYSESFADYVNFLKNNPRYKNALENASNSIKYTRSLQQAGYATDPAYAEKIMSIVNSKEMNNALQLLAK